MEEEDHLDDDGHEDVGEGCEDARGVQVVVQHVPHEHRQAGGRYKQTTKIY